MKRAPALFFSVLLATTLLFGGATALAQSPSPPVLNVAWTLTQMDGVAVPADPPITATFADSGALSGSGGCNDYTATWTGGEGIAITISDLTATFKACDTDVSAREDRYFRLIQAAATASFDGSAITITTSDGSTLVFGGDQGEPQGMALVGSWVLDTLDDEAPPADLSVTLEVTADGTLSGSACNDYSAGYTATAQGGLTVGPITATRRSCGDSDAFAGRYLDALQGASGWGWQLSGGGTLHLFGAADLLFHDASAVDLTLTGQEWRLVAIGGESVDASLGQSATFADDGTVSGSGGCNTFSGPYTVDGGSISIGPLISSRMSCGDDADLSEVHYLSALEAAVGFAISGTDLVITTSTGADLELSAQAGPVPTGSPEVTPQASPAATPAVTPAVTPVATPVATPEASPVSTAGASPIATPEISPGPSSGASPAASGAVSGSIVGSWKLTTYVGSSLPPGMLSIDITFAPDGTFSGFGGCNDYSGQWSLDGTKLTITGFESASSGTCDSTSQSLEQGYFSLLPFVDTAQLAEDGTLKLTASLAGDTGFEFQPAG